MEGPNQVGGAYSSIIAFCMRSEELAGFFSRNSLTALALSRTTIELPRTLK